MPDAKGSSFGFINSLLILLVSFGLALLLLWAASRVAGASAFEQLPEWLRSGYSALFTALVSGGSLCILVVNAIKEKSGPNYLVAIVGVTVLLLIIILVLAKAFPQRESSKTSKTSTEQAVPSSTNAEASAPVAATPAHTETLHTEDKDGHPYVVNWQMVPNCAGFVANEDHRCTFTRTQMSFAGDNTPYDHWDMSVKAPGAVYDVLCQTTGSNEFNEVKGDLRGLTEGDWARCRGWINGGDAPVNITVRYKMLW